MSIIPRMKIGTKAIIALIGVTIMWGITFPLIKNAIVYIPSTAFVALRLLIAALLWFPLVWTRLRNTHRTLLLGALVIGLLNSATYLFQTIGLETTSSANSAFITASSVILVPLLSPLFRTGHLRILDIITALIALLGIFILTGANIHHMTVGDVWTLGCAICYALFIIVLQKIHQKKIDVGLLVFYQILFALPIPLLLSIYNHDVYVFNRTVWVGLLFCSGMATCLALYMQNAYQKYTTVTKAALIYVFEPVFATIFAFFLNEEPVTRNTFLGGVLVLLGFLIAVLFPKFRLHREVASQDEKLL